MEKIGPSTLFIPRFASNGMMADEIGNTEGTLTCHERGSGMSLEILRAC